MWASVIIFIVIRSVKVCYSQKCEVSVLAEIGSYALFQHFKETKNRIFYNWYVTAENSKLAFPFE